MFSWIFAFCLLEALLIWYCASNRQKFARRMFLAGAAMLVMVGAADAFARILFYQNVFESGFVGLAVLMVVAGVMTSFAGFIGLLMKKIWGRWLVGTSAVLLAAFVSWVLYANSPVARVALSSNRYCTIQFHQLYPGSGVLSYYDDGVHVGSVHLASGLLEHPWAVFPGPNGQSVICLSELDTTYAAFTVELAKPERQGAAIPFALQEAVDSSDFQLRACTRKEVNYVASLIKTADANRLANYWRGGVALPDDRIDLATFLLYATSANDWRDPVLSNAKPQLMPDGESPNSD